MYGKIGLSLLVGLFAVFPTVAADDDRGTPAYPLERLHQDWMRQDARRLDISACFARTDSCELEQQMVRKVLDEMKSRGAPPAVVEAGARELASLAAANTAGADPAWRRLYFQLCQTRRRLRLQIVSRFAERYIYAKHCQLANQPSFASTAFLSDSVYKDRLGDWKMGSELCQLTVAADGQVTSETLLRQPEGIIRDPCASFSGTEIAFSMRTSEHADDYHLYVLHWPDRSVQQITFGPGTADVEPCWLPEGDIIFASTRCDISVPCWSSDATNLYRCDGEGRYLRRLGYDQAHTLYPQILHDGRIVYTRWEYNDRVSGKVHKLFVMNPDGTAQIEFYGNNSHSPRSMIHARPIAGSQRLLVIGSGHHTDQSGKLMRLDRSKGTQEDQGLEYVAPVRPFEPNRDDFFGQQGELFQYPLPIDEDNYLVSFNPEGGPPRGAYESRFGIYWMNSAGDRELLVYDPAVSCGQHVPLAPRTPPFFPRPDSVHYDRDEGTFYVQNVYFGAGLQGVPQGTVKKLRIVALSYRAMSAGVDYNQPSSQVHTPVSIGNGSWDVKHVLGTVDVAPDGSAYFTVPARRAVYFQLLDEKGYVIQTMRSWTTLMPGETFACLGCHENKHDALSDSKPSSLALRRPPQRPVPFYQEGEVAPQEQLQFLSPAQRRAYEYLNVNAPQGMDVPQGFSYLREIQPIWDAHCVGCHTGRKQADESAAPLSLLADTKDYGWKEAWEGVVCRPKTAEYVYPQTGKDLNPGRDYCESYVNLTRYGRVCYEQVNDLVNWLPMATSEPPMIPPYSFGSSKSRLMQYLEPAHYGVALMQREKDRVACWIDLNVPYCGSYMEANKWDTIVHAYIHSYRDQCRGAYLFQEAKRLRHAEIELAHLDLYWEHLQHGSNAALEMFPRFDLGGMDAQRQFVEAYNQLPNTVPIFGLAEGKARGGSHVKGNGHRNLALNPHAATFQLRSYPHVTSNSHFKYLPEFSPRNVVDGNAAAGEETPQVPHWRPNRRTDLWLKIEFGRMVETDRVVLYLWKLPNQEKTWSSATLEFSNGHKVSIALKSTTAAQEFVFPNQLTAWVKLSDLRETFPLGDNGVTEWEVYGKDAE